MTDPSPIRSGSDNGFLLRIAGKAIALASVVALSLPLLAFGQVAGVVPGGMQSDHYATLDSLTAAFNRPAYTQTVDIPTLKPVGQIYERFDESAGYAYRGPNEIDDTAIGAYGVFGGLAGAGILGAAGSAFANAAERRTGNTAAVIAGTAQATGDALTANKPLNIFMAFDLADGKPGPVAKGAAAGYMVILAAAAVGLPTYLSGKSFYDNFIRQPAPAPVPGG